MRLATPRPRGGFRVSNERSDFVACEGYRSNEARTRGVRASANHERKTLIQRACSSVVFSAIEALVVALGGSITEREGSRIKITLQGEQWHCHRPHPGKHAKRYQVEEARELLERIGVTP